MSYLPFCLSHHGHDTNTQVHPLIICAAYMMHICACVCVCVCFSVCVCVCVCVCTPLCSCLRALRVLVRLCGTQDVGTSSCCYHPTATDNDKTVTHYPSHSSFGHTHHRYTTSSRPQAHNPTCRRCRGTPSSPPSTYDNRTIITSTASK